ASALATAFALMLGYLAHIYVHRVVVAVGFLLSIIFVRLGRRLTRSFLRRLYTDPNIAIPLVIAGFNPFAQRLCEQISNDLTQYDMLGFVDDAAAPGSSYQGYPVLAKTEDLGNLAALHSGLELIIANPDESVQHHENLIRLCQANRVRWHLVPPLFRSVANLVNFDLAGGVPLLGPLS